MVRVVLQEAAVSLLERYKIIGVATAGAKENIQQAGFPDGHPL
jgi:hypothetical protein